VPLAKSPWTRKSFNRLSLEKALYFIALFAFGGNEEEEKINVKDILLDMFKNFQLIEALLIAILQDSVLLLHPPDWTDSFISFNL
jgi:hypothetical protein